MVMGLALLPLWLAATSDEEGGNEEAWAERFAQVDAERKSCGIPPLSLRERTNAIIKGHPWPRPGDLVVGFHAKKTWYACVFWVQSIPSRALPGGIWKKGMTVNEIIHRGPGHTLSKGWKAGSIEACNKEIKEMAQRFLLPYGYNIHLECVIEEVHYPW
jgi:hypothetical protein